MALQGLSGALLGLGLLCLSRVIAVEVVKSENGRLEYTLSVDVTTWHVPHAGISFTTRAYNGQIPGPRLEVKQGDRVTLKVKNNLGPNPPGSNCSTHAPGQFMAANATNLHIHGIFDDEQHDNTFLCMESGETFVYDYLIDPRAFTSTLFFHPHMDGASAMQLYGGMAGAFIIRNEQQDEAFGLSKLKEDVVVMQMLDFNPDSSGYIEQFMANANGDVATSTLPLNLQNPQNFKGVLLLSNNEIAPTAYTLALGEQGILRLINAMSGSNNIAHLAFIGSSNSSCQLDILAYDGVYLQKARRQSSVFVPAGGRADLAVKCHTAGLHCLTTTGLSSPSYGPYGGLVEAGHEAVCVSVDPVERVGTELTSLPGPPLYYTDLMSKFVHPTGYGTMMFSDMEGSNSVDGHIFNGSVTTNISKGSIEEWHIYGGEGPGALSNYHPWHMHNTHFQVLDISYDPHGLVSGLGDWRDTVPLYLGVNYTIRFVAPFANRIMVHCHILKHEDLGMMTLWDVQNAPMSHPEENPGRRATPLFAIAPAAEVHGHPIQVPSLFALSSLLAFCVLSTLGIVGVWFYLCNRKRYAPCAADAEQDMEAAEVGPGEV